MFEGEIQVDEIYFCSVHKSKRGRVLRVKSLYSIFSSETVKFIPLRCQVHNLQHYYTTYYPWTSKAWQYLFTPILTVVMMFYVSEFSHFWINYCTYFAEDHNHINGIKNFSYQTKRHLRKFNDISKGHLEMYLNRSEGHFNNSNIKS